MGDCVGLSQMIFGALLTKNIEFDVFIPTHKFD